MSTPTLERPAAAASPPPGRPAASAGAARTPSGSGAAAFGARSTAGRTFRTWLGLALGLTPLFMIIDDSRWYVVGIGATIVAVGPAWALRWWRPDLPARVWQLLPGLILLPLYLTAVCVPTGAWAGLVPTKVTWTQLSLLHEELVETIARSTAPIESTPGVRLALAALLGVGIVLVDVLCTVLEAPAMVGVVLLPVFVLSGATVRQPVALWWFVLAAVGYLLILTTTGPEARPWGRAIGRRPAGAPPSLVSGRAIGVAAVLVALVLPFLSGGSGGNVIADALHTGPGDGPGNGNGTGGVTQLASLKGSLTRGAPIDLMTVKVPAGAPVEPFYLRQSVLDVFTGDGWVPAGGGDLSAVQRGGLPQQPARPAVDAYTFRADINVSGLDGRAVTFADTTGVAGLPGGARWDSGRGTFADAQVSEGTRYTVAVAQPNPSAQQLAAATDQLPTNFPDRWRGVPDGLDPVVATTARQVVGNQTNPYVVARTLSDWFRNPANGFRYSLDVPEGDSGNDVVDFLRNKTGFCQQYAATMAVMLRALNVPSRVVVGYTHVTPDSTGTFTVSTRDAHAWVEAYVGGVGWLSFDPTPLSGTDAARSVTPSYLSPGGGGTAVPTGNGATATGTASGPGGAPGQANAGDGGLSALDNPQAATIAAPDHTGRWVALAAAVVVVVLLLATPAVLRARRRRASRKVTGTGGAEARFADLRDTCVDLDLDWSSARSPRAVGAWLVGHGVPEAAARPLVTAVEGARYGRTPPDVDPRTLDAALARVTAGLRAHAGRLDRLRARVWPRSVTLDLRARTRERLSVVREAFARAGDRPAGLRGLGRR